MKIKALLNVMLCVLMSSFSAGAADQVFFYHTDRAGTPLSMTDANGAVVWKADYKPFGEENSITGSAANNKRFVGKEKDVETGLSYFGARYEDAKTGRFIAVDPVGAVDSRTNKTNEKALANPQRMNAYAYAFNNPFRYTDPDGKDPYLAFSSEPNNALKCHVNPHFDRTENVIGGLIVGGGLAGAYLAPAEGIWASPSGGRQIINGIEYTVHALERMAPVGLIQQGKQIMSRGVPPSVVENAIKFGNKIEGNVDAVVHTYENVKVVTNEFATRVITVITSGK